MQTCFRLTNLITMLLSATFFYASGIAQESETHPFVRPIVGSRMVVGDGEVQEYTLKCFLHLCGKASPKVVLIQLDGSSQVAEAKFREFGAGSVLTMDSIPSDAELLTLQMLNADGVWIEGAPEAIGNHPLLLALLKNVNGRNGVIAVRSSSVSLLGELDDNDRDKRLQSPFAKCSFHFGQKQSGTDVNDKDSHLKVHWSIPDSTALVVHRGRQIAGYGHEDIRVTVEKGNGWPERSGTFECPDVFSTTSHPFYGLDLLSWIRSANERSRPVFPPEEVPHPAVDQGILFLHGGSKVSPQTMREFVQLAGGKDASIVCIPSAKRFDWPDQPDSYGGSVLHEIGHSNFSTLHSDDPFLADQSEEFAEQLKNAKGVWIDGGRTFRFMDSYEGTQVQKLIADVLKRGGVVGGSSAGCQVPGDFLVRGNPKSNRDLVFGGYTRGLGLLKGVIIDAHFLQRGRHEPFLKLMEQHPQRLGIGIDERTALIVKGQMGKVLGEASVSFYDLKDGANADFKPVILESGESYDLKMRKKQN